jgi:hypothetical protein
MIAERGETRLRLSPRRPAFLGSALNDRRLTIPPPWHAGAGEGFAESGRIDAPPTLAANGRISKALVSADACARLIRVDI